MLTNWPEFIHRVQAHGGRTGWLARMIGVFLSLLLLYVPAARGQAPVPITLTPVAPQILSTTQPNTGDTFSATPNANGSVSFALTSPGTIIVNSFDQFGTRSEMGVVKLTPPAGLMGVDAGDSLNFSALSYFVGSENLMANTNAGVTVAAVNDTIGGCGGDNLPIELISGGAAGTPGGEFPCALFSLPVGTVNGNRLAYYDVNITAHYDYARDNPAPNTAKVRFFFALPPPAASFSLTNFFERLPDGVSDCTNSPVRTYYFCNSQYDQRGVGAGFNFDHSPVAVRYAFAPNDLKGTIKLVLRESVYGGPDQTTLLMNYDILPTETSGFSSRDLHGLYPHPGVYRWTFEATLTTASGQILKDNTKTFDVASIWVINKDMDGFTPQFIPSDSVPTSLCIQVFYNNTFDPDLYLQPLTYYGTVSDVVDLEKDRLLVPAHTLNTSGVRLCHDINPTLFVQKFGALLQVQFENSAYPYINGVRIFTLRTHATVPQGPSTTKAGPTTLGTIFNALDRATDVTESKKPITEEADATDILYVWPIDDPLGYNEYYLAPLRQQSFGLPATMRSKAASARISPPQRRGFSAPSAMALRPQDVIAINNTVQFRQPIPNDGSFSANLTYSYDPTDLPKNPNFNESALQLLSYDPASNTLQAYPSTVDTVNHTVTAMVNSLPPYVSAGVVGPFPGVTLTSLAPSDEFAVGLSFVNMGADGAQLTVTDYSAGGGTSPDAPVSLSLGAGQQISSSGTGVDTLLADGWVQTASDKSTVTGVALLAGTGGSMDALPLASSDSALWILTGVEMGNGVSTEVVLANTTDSAANVNLGLRDQTGALAGTAQRTVEARQSLHEGADSLFPAAPQPFLGLIEVLSSQRLVASRIWQGGSSLAAVNGKTPLDLIGTPHFVVPFVTGGGTASRVNLVNPVSSDANVTLRALAPNGAPAGQPVTITVPGGGQYWNDIATIFQIPSGTTITPGSLIIDSASSLFGDISFGDAQYRLWSSIALSQPAPSMVVPLVSNQAAQPMGVVVVNSGSAVANVALHVLRPDGTESGAAKWTIPAGGLTYDLLTARVPASAGQNGGHLHLDSDQPVTVVGLIGTLTQASDIATIPGVATTIALPPVTGSGSGSPAISVSPRSLAFGPVTVGQPPTTMKFTIGNTGQADLHVTSIKLSGDPSFSLVPAFAPVTLAAGTSTSITVQFAPTSAGTPAGSASIASDDPDPTHNPLTVSLTGTANPATTGGGGSCVPPPANLVSWWSGDGNANDSTGGNNGTVQGGTTFATGDVGQAFQFDGSTGYVSAGNPASLQLPSAITVEAWINPHAAPAANTMSAILTKWAQIFNPQPDSDSYGLWLRQDPTAGLILFGAIHQAGTSEPNVQGGTIPLNTWTHVAMTFDSGTGTLVAYVNGRAVNSLTSPGPIVTSSRNVFIGREDSFLPRPFNGLIDELSVYGRALSASEIQAIYSAGSAGKCKAGSPTNPAPSITVTPQSLAFGSVPVGQSSQSKTITVTNTGASPVTVNLLTSAPFAVSPTSLNLAANGGAGTASVTFTPASAGSSASSINIDISGQSTPAASVMLTGSGTAATTGGGTGMIVSLTVDPGSYDKNSGTFTVGQPNQGYMSWDTDDSNKTNWIMGVSVPPETSPLLNIPGQKGLKNPIAPGTYYTYYHPESWGNDIRLTVHWSDKTTDVAYFNVAGFGVNQNWPWEGGSPNLTTVIYKTTAVSTVFRVTTTAENTSPGNGASSEVLAITINAGGGGPTGPTGTVLLSDSFHRADTSACSLGQADLALGGSGSHFYLPIFPGATGPVGANIVSGALQNNGLDFGGVQLAASAGACANAGIRGENLGQDLDIRVDLLVPGSPGKVTNGGPYFRSRAAAAGDGIIGGTSAGYWVRLVSTGEVRVTGLNPFAPIATTGVPAASFNAGVNHTLEASARGSSLQVTLDGVLQTFTQNGSAVTTVSLPATGGTNDGTVGIAFASDDNRGLAGGQRASNLVIAAVR